MKTQVYAIGNPDDFLSRMRKIIKEEIHISMRSFNPNDDDIQFIKIDEVSRLLHLSRPAIYDRIKEGKITLYKEGRNSFFDREEIMSLINPSPTNQKK